MAISYNQIFNNYKVENDAAKTEAEKEKTRLNAKEMVSIVSLLDDAANKCGFGGIKLSSGFRSTASLKALYDLHMLPSGKCVPSTAKPGTSAHEWGSGIDCSPVSGTFNDFVKFAMKWFDLHKIKFDLLIDESRDSNNHNGWLHIGLKGAAGLMRGKYYIMWGDYIKLYGTSADYVSAREKICGGSSSANTTSTYTESYGLSAKKYSDTESQAARAAYLQSEEELEEQMLNNALAEYTILEANNNTYTEYTEAEIIEAEADYDLLDNLLDEPSSSPMESQEVNSSTALDSSSANVFNSAEDNTSSVSVDDSSDSSTKEHTRIYQFIKPTILLNEMSLSLDGTVDEIDPSTGIHKDALNDNTSEPPTSLAGSMGVSPLKTFGTTMPLIHINGRYLGEGDIRKFEMHCTDFMPTIMLEIDTHNNDFLKNNIIRDGAIVSIFMQVDHGMLKSYRGDFKVTSTYIFPLRLSNVNSGVHMMIYGELYIPNMYNGQLTFSFPGTSNSALQDAATKLGLGFNSCDDEDTNDFLVWLCVATGFNKTGGKSTIGKYIQNVAKHAYKDFNSFYDCWIDPRYAITFLNINKMLGADDLDENVDMAFYNNSITNAILRDANNIDKSAEEKKKDARPLPKLITNIKKDLTSLTSFFAIKFNEENNLSVTDRIGMNVKDKYIIKNGALNSEQNGIDLNISICINKKKLLNGFYILGGPGEEITYKQADNGDFAQMQSTVKGGQITNTLSDSDVEDMKSSGSNMLASGNTNKFYKLALRHNELNNLWLKKKQLRIELNGNNMQIMRGEKIPVLMMDETGKMNTGTSAQDDTLQLIFQQYSGWFIISGIVWKYNIAKEIGGTPWSTEVLLTRREWPIENYTKNASTDEAAAETTKDIVITNDITDENVKESISEEELQLDTSTNESENTSTTVEITTEGLANELKEIWNKINENAKLNGHNINLISAKRWGLDSDGNKKEDNGPSELEENGKYAFVNCNGDRLYFINKTSSHVTGNAIDIVNGNNTEYKDILIDIMSSDEILAYMFKNGLYAVSEAGVDDTGNNVKHIHVAKVDNSSPSINNCDKWWESVKTYLAKNGNSSGTITYGSEVYDIDNYYDYC